MAANLLIMRRTQKLINTMTLSLYELLQTNATEILRVRLRKEEIKRHLQKSLRER
jgi:hypothetical protein